MMRITPPRSIIIIKESRAMGFEDFFIGGDNNIEPKLEALKQRL